GVAVFFSVLILGSLVWALRTAANPQVQPAALIRKTDTPGAGIQGLYVNRTDKEVVLASVAVDGCSGHIINGSGRIESFAHDDVAALSIGRRQNVEAAVGAAPEMLKSLIASRPTGGAAPPKTGPKTA